MKYDHKLKAGTENIHRSETVFRALALSLNISEEFFVDIHQGCRKVSLFESKSLSLQTELYN